MKRLLISLSVILTFFVIGCEGDNDEQIKPTILLIKGIDTIDVGSDWSDNGCIATDEKGAEIECKMIENNIDNTEVGNYNVIYEAVDSNGLTSRKTRVVNVLDLSGPIITLNPGIDTIIRFGTWVDSGCTAVDNYDAEVVCEYNSGKVKTNKVGQYVIEYKAVDSAGNESYARRIVHVVISK